MPLPVLLPAPRSTNWPNRPSRNTRHAPMDMKWVRSASWSASLRRSAVTRGRSVLDMVALGESAGREACGRGEIVPASASGSVSGDGRWKRGSGVPEALAGPRAPLRGPPRGCTTRGVATTRCLKGPSQHPPLNSCAQDGPRQARQGGTPLGAAQDTAEMHPGSRRPTHLGCPLRALPSQPSPSHRTSTSESLSPFPATPALL